MLYNDPNQPQMAPLQTNAINAQAASPSFQTPQFTPAGVQIPTQNATFFQDQYGNLNMQNLQTALGGIQAIGSLWNSFQQNRLAKKSLGLQTRAFETNLANQTQTYNTALEDRIRARYATEGRSGEADAYIERNKL